MTKVVINVCFGGYGSFSEEAIKLYKELGGQAEVRKDRILVGRTDEILIQVIERLGSKADGEYSSYEIEEVPDGFDWDIDEYDGAESLVLIPIVDITKLISLSNDREALKKYLEDMDIRYKD